MARSDNRYGRTFALNSQQKGGDQRGVRSFEIVLERQCS